MKQKNCSPSLIKYLAAIIYDLFLLFGLLLFITVMISFANNGNPPESNNILYRLALLSVIIFFYHYSWNKSGQTLGIANICTLGLGFFWKYTNKSRLTLMDLFSKTQLINLK